MLIPRWRVLAVLLLLVCLSAPLKGVPYVSSLHGGVRALPVSAQADTAPPLLVVGARLEQPAVARQTYRYEVALETGDFFDLQVSQDQLIVTLTIAPPDGQPIFTTDLPQIEPLPERLQYIAPVAGVYRIDVRANGTATEFSDGHDIPGRLELQVLALGPATTEQIERAGAAAIAARAGALANERSLGALGRAVPVYVEAADAWRRLGDRQLEATTLRSLGRVTSLFTQYSRDAAAAMEREIDIWRALGDVRMEWQATRELAIEYVDDGRIVAARDANRAAIRLSSTFSERADHAADLRNLARDELRLGNYEEARRLVGQSLEMSIAIGSQRNEALALDVLARLQDLSGDPASALQSQQRAQALVSDSATRRRLLQPLGFYQLRVGDIDAAARAFEENLALGTSSIQRDWDALAYIGRGDVAMARGQAAAARIAYEKARELLRTSGYREHLCKVESRVGQLSLDAGDHVDAAARFAAALAIAEDLGHAVCEAESRVGLADLAEADGRLDEAQAQAVRVVALVDGFREASVNVDARTVGFSALAPAYERAIDLTMRLAQRSDDPRQIASGLALHERALARGLLDGLTAERLERRARVPEALAADRRRLRETWRARVVEREAALQRKASDVARTLLGDISALTTRLRDVESRIDAIDPRHASFVRPPALDVDGLRALLDEDTVLLEYALGAQRSYVWIVDRERTRAVALSPRPVIEAAARRVYRQLSQTPDGPATARDVAERTEALREMARLVLEPLGVLRARRLVFVTSGALGLVPFGVLPMRQTPRDTARALIDAYEVVSLPSATVLAALRRLEGERPRAAKSAVVFADPVYERDDPRLQQSTLRGVELKRLPFSRREADAVRRYASDEPLTIVGLEATRERVMRAPLSDYRIVHFATHGVVQTDVPDLSGVALSLVDRRGRARDGFLMLPDVYELKLNAELVVLSACQTALGTQIRGEGVIGLPRGFMYAGASRVISTLWRIDDEATAALMEAFYRRLLRDGMTAAAALRGAQLEMRRAPQRRDPFFWAGFVLQGDWR